MEIRNLATFLAVCDAESFSRAAVRLGYAQSTVTLQIRQLEDEIGVRLFDRAGKRIRITAEGKQLRILAELILSLSRDALAIGKTDLPAEPLRVGFLESLQNRYAPALISSFHHAAPGVPLFIKTGPIRLLAERLLHNRLDLIFICNERLHDPRLIPLYEKEEPVSFVASPAHPLSGRACVSYEDLAGGNFLQTENDSSYGLALNRYLSQKGITLSSYLDIETPDVVLSLVRAGEGVAFLPDYLVEGEIAAGTLSRLAVDTSAIHVWIQAFCCRDKFVTPAMRDFLSLFTEMMEKRKIFEK